MKKALITGNTGQDREYLAENRKNPTINTFQRTTWQELLPSERLRRSYLLRRRLKNLEKIHDKKIFPRP